MNMLFSTIIPFSFLKKIKRLSTSIFFPTSPTISSIEKASPKEINNFLPQSPISTHPFVINLFNYKNDSVREVIYHIKYRGNIILIDSFGKLLYQKLELKFKEKLSKKEKIHIIPIPLSKERLSERKFNQSDLLGRSIIKNDKNGFFVFSPHFLKKTVNTTPQTKLKRKARLKNVKNCFSVPEKEKRGLRGKTMVLVDDVTTTGSTLKEARITLLKSGAKEVYAITLAH